MPTVNISCFWQVVTGSRSAGPIKTSSEDFYNLEVAFGLDNLLALVHPGFQVNMVPPGQLTGGGVFLVMRLAEFIVRTPLTPPGFGYFTLWNSHCLILSVVSEAHNMSKGPENQAL